MKIDLKDVDLLTFPMPYADESVEEIVCNRILERIPELYWTPALGISPHMTAGDVEAESLMGSDGRTLGWTRRLTLYPVNALSVDLLLKVMDELHRILVPGGKLSIVCAQAHNDRAFHPLSRRHLTPESFRCLSAAQRTEDLGISCDFHFSMAHGVTEYQGKQRDKALLQVPPQARTQASQDRTESLWNVVEDLHVTLTKISAPIAPTGSQQRVQEGAAS